MESDLKYIVRPATAEDGQYAVQITEEMADSAKKRGTGIARRSPEYVEKKMGEGKAIIAVNPETKEWVGFSYIEAWQDKAYVANSGLIVNPKYRGLGVAREIKTEIFNLSRVKYPHAKIFGLTTGSAVMKINSSLGYRPVTYSELTQDDVFWEGCKSCVNYPILMSKGRKNCLCTAMLYDPAEHQELEDVVVKRKVEPPKTQEAKKRRSFKGNMALYERWLRYKRYVLLKSFRKQDSTDSTTEKKKKKYFLF